MWISGVSVSNAQASATDPVQQFGLLDREKHRGRDQGGSRAAGYRTRAAHRRQKTAQRRRHHRPNRVAQIQIQQQVQIRFGFLHLRDVVLDQLLHGDRIFALLTFTLLASTLGTAGTGIFIFGRLPRSSAGMKN